jgi:hypothetical protein
MNNQQATTKGLSAERSFTMRAPKRLGMSLLAITLGALVLFGTMSTSTAHAGSGIVGTRQTIVGCYENQLIATVDMRSTQSHWQGQTIFVGGTPTQAGAYRIHVFYSPTSAQGPWTYSGYSSDWYKIPVLGDDFGNQPTAAFMDVQNLRTSKWESAARQVRLLRPGFYRVAVDYYWYPTQFVISGSVYEWGNYYYDGTPLNVFAYAQGDACKV